VESTYGAAPGDAGMTGAAGEAIGQVKQQAGQVVQQTREMTGQALDRARSEVKSQISSQKDRAAGALGSVADAIRMTGQNLQQGDQAGIAQYADRAAEMVDGLTGYLREHDVDDLITEVESFARRQPALFLGGAFMLGFCAARFLRSSAPAGTRSITPYQGGGQDYSSYRYTRSEGTPLPTAYDRARSQSDAALGTTGGAAFHDVGAGQTEDTEETGELTSSTQY
jgi:uncharacterized protein YjbJ (UPF0337 family)